MWGSSGTNRQTQNPHRPLTITIFPPAHGLDRAPKAGSSRKGMELSPGQVVPDPLGVPVSCLYFGSQLPPSEEVIPAQKPGLRARGGLGEKAWGGQGTGQDTGVGDGEAWHTS